MATCSGRPTAAYGGTSQDYLKVGESSSKTVIEPTLNTAADARTVVLLDGKDVVAIDRGNGRQRWRTTIDPKADLWVGALMIQDGVVLQASKTRLVALAAESGKLLWEQPKSDLGHLWYEWKDVFVINGRVWTWSAETKCGDAAEQGVKGKTKTLPAPTSANAYNLHSGALEKQVPLGNLFVANHHHRCYRNRATDRYILASRRGTEFVDLSGGENTLHNWVRGTCHFGMLPANGLQYAPPHPCICYIQEKLNGFNALAPEIPAKDRREESPVALAPAGAGICVGPGRRSRQRGLAAVPSRCQPIGGGRRRRCRPCSTCSGKARPAAR